MNTFKNILITIAVLFAFNTTNGWCNAFDEGNPKADSCQVAASVYPASAGTVEGCGYYPVGELCTLTAIPAEGCEFRYWIINGRIWTSRLTFTRRIESDMLDIEAHFTYKPIGLLTAYYAPEPDNPFCSEVSLSWEYEEKEWTLLKQFDLHGEQGVAPRGDYIFTCNYSRYSPSPLLFGKYTMEGDLVELFEIEGAYPNGFACDGKYFYFSDDRSVSSIPYLYRYDLDQKVLLDRTYVGMQFFDCAYDEENDGFWISDYPFNTSGTTFTLKNRQGQNVMSSPRRSNLYSEGFGVITAKDGTRHLIITQSNGDRWDYNTSINDFVRLPNLYVSGSIRGASVGKYDGKDAMYIVTKEYASDSTSTLMIYEINSQLEQAIGYNIYRADSEGQIVTLAEVLESNTFTDTDWGELTSGMYRYGISEVYSNGNESEIIWSEPIEKLNIGVEENAENSDSSIKKVIEDGKIIIIKDGKRFSITGQQLN
jgi:hypothetical protein